MVHRLRVVMARLKIERKKKDEEKNLEDFESHPPRLWILAFGYQKEQSSLPRTLLIREISLFPAAGNRGINRFEDKVLCISSE